MQIELYKFSKRINSTKRPVAGSGFTTQCTIKQNAPYIGKFGSSSDTTICYPVLFLTGVDNPNAYNYVKAFGDRYYFIRDIQIDLDGAATLHCEIDALATRKNEILASTQYVIYSASNYDKKIADPRLPLRNVVHVDYDVQNPTTPEFDAYDQTYIVTALSQDTNLSTIYAMTAYQMSQVAFFLTEVSAQSLLDELKIYLRAPADAIMSIYRTPYKLTNIGQPTDFQLGHLTIQGIGVKVLNTSERPPVTRTQNLVLSLPVLPQDIDYRYSDAYSKYIIRIPYCDDMEISGDRLVASNTMSVVLNIYYDLVNGDVYAIAETNDTPSASRSRVLGWTSGNIYFEVPWGTVGSFAAPALVGAFKTIANNIGIGGSVSTSESDKHIINTTSKGSKSIRNFSNDFSANGGASFSLSGGDLVNIFEAGYENARGKVSLPTGAHGYSEGYVTNGGIYLYRCYNEMSWSSIEEVKNINGLPLNRVVQLSTLSGFCQCKNPSIVIDDLKILAELINRYLSGGFFIE